MKFNISIKHRYYFTSVICASLLLILLPAKNYSQKAVGVPMVTITVSDLDEVLPFYTEVLGFQLLSIEKKSGSQVSKMFGTREEETFIQVASLQLGEERIELMDFIQPVSGDPVPPDSRSNDLWFQHIAIVTNDMEEAYTMLKKHRVQHVSTAPQTLPDYIPAAAGIKAFYFRDPDGHNLEVIYFPPGKGNPKWQKASGGPLIGIDHTAIGILDTKTGLEFYRDILGLKVAGNSENYGPEQEHLNQVFGAHLIITGLSASNGIGIEFLEYIAPPGGKSYPADSDVYDLWHWHTVIRVSGLEQIYHQLIQQKYEIISNGLVSINGHPADYSKACMVRDPDGHAVLLLE